MTNRRKLGAVVVAATLLGAGVTAAITAPDVAGGVSSAVSAPWASHGHGPKGQGDAAVFDAAAKALGISSDELKGELASGKTIAQVASDKGVDVNVVIDAMVAAAQTELRDHITDLVNKGGPKHHDKGPGGKVHDIDAAALALGISTDDLAGELRAGKSVAQVAGEKGVDVNTVITAIVNAKTAEIDADVASGKTTQAEADEHKAELTEHVTDMVNKTPPPHGGPKDRGHGRGPDKHDDDDSSSSSSSSS